MVTLLGNSQSFESINQREKADSKRGAPGRPLNFATVSNDQDRGCRIKSRGDTAVGPVGRHVRRLVEQPEPLPFVTGLTEVF